MKMYKICVVGRFKEKNKNGQTIKTKNLVRLLNECFGNVDILDTKNITKKPFVFLLNLIRNIKKNEIIIILPAQNGVKILLPVISILNKFFHKRIIYDVIGAWIPSLLHQKKYLIKFLNTFDSIWVETKTLQIELKKMSSADVVIIPNFKFYSTELKEPYSFIGNDLRLCVFSRIEKYKGIDDAINVVRKINVEDTSNIQLDIYGSIDNDFKSDFLNLLKENKFASYKGVIEPAEAINVLKNYYALLFPTKYKTEGIPGTIIDAFSSGIPVIASKWNSFDDLIKDGYDGLGFEFGNLDEFENKVRQLAENRIKATQMRKNALASSEKYKPYEAENRIREIFEKLDAVSVR